MLRILLILLSLGVLNLHSAESPSFRHDVLPIISKAGCNTGGCHGALAGKGGFRLSLFGYNPDADYLALTREARGRRVEMSDPGSSLFLTKPSGALAHKGGKRFDVDSEDYRILASWIAAGCPAPTAEDIKITGLEISPAENSLRPGQTMQLSVKARYSDGRERDITRWAKFTSTDETVASVDAAGNLTVLGSGQGAITAWFSSQIVIARVVVPYPNKLAPDVFTNAPKSGFIDDLVLEQLQKLNLPPSPSASDGAFIRRAYLDTIGRLPTPEETRRFISETSPGKFERLADLLLARPEFIDYWTYKWSDVLLLSGAKLRPAAINAYYQWIRNQVAANTPWDELARGVVTSRGSTLEQGAANFFAVHQDPETMAENVSQAFLSLSINCAKCHNHPLEKWTNDQYYAFANLFARVRSKGWGGARSTWKRAAISCNHAPARLSRPRPWMPRRWQPTRRRIAARLLRNGSPPPRIPISRVPSQIVSGRISWARASWNRWMTCGFPIRRAMKNCSPHWPTICGKITTI